MQCTARCLPGRAQVGREVRVVLAPGEEAAPDADRELWARPGPGTPGHKPAAGGGGAAARGGGPPPPPPPPLALRPGARA